MSKGMHRSDWVPVVEISRDEGVRERVEDLLDGGESLIILDLTRKPELDSLVLGQLVACREHARRHGALIKLVVTPRQHEFVTATKLDFLFETFRNEEEALDSCLPWDTTAGIP